MKAVRRSLGWSAARARRRMVRTVTRRLYRDTDRDPRKSVLLAGTARSGSTWLAQVVRSQTAARIMFEPFHPGKIAAYRRFELFHYVRPEDDDPELLDYCRRIFSGDVRHPWIDREVDLLRPRLRLIKAIRACFLLGWIRRCFAEVPIVFIIRHPCAVVASRMKLGWATDDDIEPCLRQAKLVEDFLGKELAFVKGLRADEEKHAFLWALHNLVALEHLAGGEGLVLFYEDLCQRPEEEVPRVFRAIGQEYTDSVFKSLRTPSTTSTSASAPVTGGDVLRRWRELLSQAQVQNVLGVVERLGLGGLYDASPTPLIEASRWFKGDTG